MDTTPHITCQQLIEFLMGYLENELPADQRAEFDRHMAACPSCVDYLTTYEKTIALTRTCSGDALPEDVPETLVQAILAARKKAM